MKHTRVIWNSRGVSINGKWHKEVSYASLLRLERVLSKVSYYHVLTGTSSIYFVNRGN